MKARGDQFLVDEYSINITSVQHAESIVFRDSIGNTYPFNRFVMGRRMDRFTYRTLIECEDGNMFRPYIDREVYELGYVSSDLRDTILLSIDARPFILIDSNEDMKPDNNNKISIDRMYIKLSFDGCEAVRTWREIHTIPGESRIRESPFVLRKHGQSYEDIYGVFTSWSNSVLLSYSNGIVGFNFCGKDYAQVVD